MNDEQFERLVVSLETIAQSLAGINETAKRACYKQWPEPRPIREAVITRIPTEEDEIRQAQGVDGTTLEDWLKIPEDETEFIGEREREFLEAQKVNAGAKPEDKGSGGGSPEEVGSHS